MPSLTDDTEVIEDVLTLRDWTFTGLDANGSFVTIGTKTQRRMLLIDEVEISVPGFRAAYKALRITGCNEYLITAAIKYCSKQKWVKGVNEVLALPGILSTVEAAVSFELDEATLANTLNNLFTETNLNVKVPNNITEM